MAILTVTEFVQSREAREAGLTDESVEDIELAITEAEAGLYSELGFWVADSATEITVYGTGESYVFLPHRAREVTTVTQDGSELADSAWFVSGGFLLKRGSRTALLEPDEWSGYWSANSEIVITGTFGYDPGYVPVDENDPEPARDPDPKYTLAKKAVRLLTVQALSSTNEDNNLPDGNLTSLTAEGASFTFGTDEELTDLLKRIGFHPLRRKGTLKVAQLTT